MPPCLSKTKDFGKVLGIFNFSRSTESQRSKGILVKSVLEPIPRIFLSAWQQHLAKAVVCLFSFHINCIASNSSVMTTMQKRTALL